jgi:3-oxoacyl-[acyl-carrier protein] reductase
MNDRVVLVSGGSRGLGAELVRAFLEDGHRVATFSRQTSDQVQRWQKDPAIANRFLFQNLDAGDSAAVHRFVNDLCDRWGNIGVLVNNAGAALDGLLPLLADDAIERLISLDLTAAITLTKWVLRRMLVAEWGRVISISSVAGRVGLRGLSVYGAAKGGLDAFTRGLAREVGAKNITVNAIAPGYLRTEMTSGMDQAQLQQVVRRTPIGRLGELADVSALTRFLASDQAAFITGQTFVVDGGFSC